LQRTINEQTFSYLMNKNIYLHIVFIILPLFVFPEVNKSQTNKIEWFTIEEALKKVRKEPRKIFIDIYTDWCGYCKRMEQNTFTHPVIVQILNDKFYPVKLNAEQDEPIIFQGQKYINENPGQRRSAHNFAIAILQGRMSYPSIAFFDEELNLITAIPGYRPPDNLEPILMFFYNDEYKTNSDLEEYIENFEGRVK